MEIQSLPVAIIGGGPVGLAAAAHLAARGEALVLFESGSEVAANVRDWRHVRVFSPWKFNIDQAARQLLEAHGWKAPDEDGLPTGGELLDRYLTPLSELPMIRPFVHFNSKVTAVSRKGLSKVKTADREKRPFVLHVEQNGNRRVFEARAVIDASGTWSNPNPANSEGIWTEDELSFSRQIHYGIPDVLGKDRARYSGKTVLVAGSGHSATNALLDLQALIEQDPGTTLYWVLRKSNLKNVYGGQQNDELPERGRLGTRLQKLVDSGKIRVMTGFHVQEFREEAGRIAVTGNVGGKTSTIEGIDEVICNTGSRPELSFLREIRMQLDPALESAAVLAPLIDPNVHSCGTVRPHGERELRQPEPNFYIVGSKSYGRAPTFLMATGYEQVRSVVAALAGDWAAAKKVQLVLPETGVCGVGVPDCCGNDAAGMVEQGAVCCAPVASSAAAGSSCCTPVASTPAAASSCCAPVAPAASSKSFRCG